MDLQVKSIIFAAVLAAPLMATAGIKSSDVEDVSISVSYSGYDLGNEAGKAMVERKIRHAAREICGDTNYSMSRSLNEIIENRACYNEAVANAMTGLEKLTAASDETMDSTES